MSSGTSLPPQMPGDEDTHNQRKALARLADFVIQRHMASPAIFMLESVKPLSFIGGQALIFFEPILEAFCTPGDYRLIAEGLQDRDNIEWLIQRLEAGEEARGRKATTDANRSTGSEAPSESANDAAPSRGINTRKDTGQMTPRERWLALLNRQDYDRVPLTYRATTEFTEKLLAFMGLDTFDQARERLHIEPVVTVSPRYVGPPLEADKDVYGIGYQYTDYGDGKYHDAVYHPLAQYDSVEEIEDNYQWPDLDWWDYSGIPDQIVGKEDYIIRGGDYEEFAAFKFLRGVTRGYMDLVEKPEIVHYCMGKLTDLKYENAARIYEQIPGKVIWTWVAEDFGTQDGLLISLEHIREFCVPYMKRMTDLVHDAGAFAFHHSDGAVSENLPQMIEIGVDVLEPIQWRCTGMAREKLKARFGDDLVFMGAMDNQQTLAFGSIEDVKQEVRDNIRILGEGGGYMLGACHNIQVVSPPENIVAMYDVAYECGWM